MNFLNEFYDGLQFFVGAAAATAAVATVCVVENEKS